MVVLLIPTNSCMHELTAGSERLNKTHKMTLPVRAATVVKCVGRSTETNGVVVIAQSKYRTVKVA